MIRLSGEKMIIFYGKSKAEKVFKEVNHLTLSKLCWNRMKKKCQLTINPYHQSLWATLLVNDLATILYVRIMSSLLKDIILINLVDNSSSVKTFQTTWRRLLIPKPWVKLFNYGIPQLACRHDLGWQSQCIGSIHWSQKTTMPSGQHSHIEFLQFLLNSQSKFLNNHQRRARLPLLMNQRITVEL